jgi:hypothetical protein
MEYHAAKSNGDLRGLDQETAANQVPRSYAIRFRRIHPWPGPGSVEYEVVYYTGGWPVYLPVSFLQATTDYWEILRQLRPLQELESRRARLKLYGDKS